MPSLTVNPFFGDPIPISETINVFVLMPFDQNFTHIYTQHIVKVMQMMDLNCIRGDDFFSSESVMSEIWSAIYHADVCIAECTGRNPNVFYEIGIAHTVGKPCILISQSIEDIPFDLRHLRTIVYDTSPKGLMNFEQKLSKTVHHYLPDSEDKDEFFADVLRDLMVQKQLTPRDIAADVQMLPSIISQWLSGTHMPNHFSLRDLVEALKLNKNEKERLLDAFLNGNSVS